MKRFPDWYKRLQDYLAAHRSDTFAYGQFDCCSFAAGAAEAITGEHVFQPFSNYSTERGAFEVIAEHGGLIRIMRRVFGKPERYGHQGDIAALRVQGQIVLGVKIGAGIACASSNGIVVLQESEACVYWRVG